MPNEKIKFVDSHEWFRVLTTDATSNRKTRKFYCDLAVIGGHFFVLILNTLWHVPLLFRMKKFQNRKKKLQNFTRWPNDHCSCRNYEHRRASQCFAKCELNERSTEHTRTTHVHIEGINSLTEFLYALAGHSVE